MGHSYNNGLHTTSKGITVDALRVTGLAVASPSAAVIAEDCKSGLVSGVTHSAVGVYVFQLSAPYPPKLVTCHVQLSAASAAGASVRARYINNSYNATTGQFQVETDVAGVATDPGANDELHVSLHLRRYSF